MTDSLELEPTPDRGPLPNNWVGDAYIQWGNASRLLRIQESDSDSLSIDTETGYRYFTIDGGIPPKFFDSELLDELQRELAVRMFSIPEFV